MQTTNNKFQTQSTLTIERFPLRYEEFKPLLSKNNSVDLTITTSKTGKALRHPVTVQIPNIYNKRDLDVTNYIIESLVSTHPTLIRFSIDNQSVFKLATHLRRHKTSSCGTLKVYIYCLSRFIDWVKKTPDTLVASCLTEECDLNSRVIRRLSESIDDYIGELRAAGSSPNTINVHVSAVRTFLKANRIEIPQILKPRIRIVYGDRSPTSEELSNLLNFADLREKVIITLLALGGFRVGTLCKLEYRHIKHDLEQNIRPIHLSVESEIVKGKTCDYDTFIGAEATKFLKDYLTLRKRGTPSGKIPPETITDTTPLIRTKTHKEPKPLTRDQLSRVIRRLYTKAGLIASTPQRRYCIRPHSLRKYFKTQLTALGTPREYIEYMMGHKISTYQDIKMKGIDFLRNIYRASNLSIQSRTKIDRAFMLKEMIRTWGYDPEKILVKEALAEPHRTICEKHTTNEENEVKLLSNALKEMMKKELLTTIASKETQTVYEPLEMYK
ncbi:tyrosine-type recombinase/integrase [Thermoproteota archaeon]